MCLPPAAPLRITAYAPARGQSQWQGSHGYYFQEQHREQQYEQHDDHQEIEHQHHYEQHQQLAEVAAMARPAAASAPTSPQMHRLLRRVSSASPVGSPNSCGAFGALGATTRTATSGRVLIRTSTAEGCSRAAASPPPRFAAGVSPVHRDSLGRHPIVHVEKAPQTAGRLVLRGGKLVPQVAPQVTARPAPHVAGRQAPSSPSHFKSSTPQQQQQQQQQQQHQQPEQQHSRPGRPLRQREPSQIAASCPGPSISNCVNQISPCRVAPPRCPQSQSPRFAKSPVPGQQQTAAVTPAAAAQPRSLGRSTSAGTERTMTKLPSPRQRPPLPNQRVQLPNQRPRVPSLSAPDAPPQPPKMDGEFAFAPSPPSSAPRTGFRSGLRRPSFRSCSSGGDRSGSDSSERGCNERPRSIFRCYSDTHMEKSRRGSVSARRAVDSRLEEQRETRLEQVLLSPPRPCVAISVRGSWSPAGSPTSLLSSSLSSTDSATEEEVYSEVFLDDAESMQQPKAAAGAGVRSSLSQRSRPKEHSRIPVSSLRHVRFNMAAEVLCA